jgi:hypothetical protein
LRLGFQGATKVQHTRIAYQYIDLRSPLPTLVIEHLCRVGLRKVGIQRTSHDTILLGEPIGKIFACFGLIAYDDYVVTSGCKATSILCAYTR